MTILTIRLNENDNVVVARVELTPGTEVPEEGVVCRENIPAGHKLATSVIEARGAIHKYGQVIGFATCTIKPGEHVHTHNLVVKDFGRKYAFGKDTRPTELVPEDMRPSFEGIIRADGKVGTRNYIGVLSTVNCSASVCHAIANAFGPEMLSMYPNEDGVVALGHDSGCCVGSVEGFELLERTLAGYARHPNFAGVLLVGLGCEQNQVRSLLENTAIEISSMLQTLIIQETGGTDAAVREGCTRLLEMIQEANRVERCIVPASHLILGLECGGSDAYSGITANPALGFATDLLICNGGTAILGETPEIYGAEHLLTRRVISREVGDELISRIRWWKTYTAQLEHGLDNNPSPGNKAGGLSTILEKSLGAVVKGGSTNLMEVLQYAEAPKGSGLVFMDTPGYDPVSVTGMVAGGANVICFTTGRGSVFGCKPVPSIKLATNTPMFQRMSEDIDLNCGSILDGQTTIQEMGEQIMRLILETASGKKTKSELKGMGTYEFVPWHVGCVL